MIDDAAVQQQLRFYSFRKFLLQYLPGTSILIPGISIYIYFIFCTIASTGI